MSAAKNTAGLPKRTARHSCVQRQLVAELLESDRIIREDARQIFALGEEVKRLRTMLPNSELSSGGPADKRQQTEQAARHC